jgi:hypothetical protein
MPQAELADQVTPRTAFRPEFARTKGWYYYKAKNPFSEFAEDSAGFPDRRYFLAFVNAKGSCSMRTFDFDTGRFLSKKYEAGNYQEMFVETIRDATELTVNSQPNLERDCRERLPERVLAYLKKQVK